jgi:hypothetical protein
MAHSKTATNKPPSEQSLAEAIMSCLIIAVTAFCKLNSLSKIQMGSYKKIQLEFEPNQVFWNKQIPMFLTSNPKITGKEYYLYQYGNSNKKNKELFPYILWNNYLYSKNKPILEAICPGDIGWEISGKPDEEIIDLVLSQLNNYFPNVPEPKA